MSRVTARVIRIEYIPNISAYRWSADIWRVRVQDFTGSSLRVARKVSAAFKKATISG